MIVGGALLLDRVANSHLHRLGVIAESVPNRTLSGIEEGGARISQRPKPLLERFGWPDVVAIEDDVLPAERMVFQRMMTAIARLRPEAR